MAHLSGIMGVTKVPDGSPATAEMIRVKEVRTSAEQVSITFTINEQVRKSRMTVYAPDGTAIRYLSVNTQRPGNHTVVWDKKDNAGDRVAKGVYLLALQVKDRMVLKKIMMIR